MSDEDRLRRRFREQVAEVPVVADLDDVAARIGRTRRGRARQLVVASLMALLVGTVGGFAAGRAGHSTERSVTVGGAGPASGGDSNPAGTLDQSASTSAPTSAPASVSTTWIVTGLSVPTRTLPAPGSEQPSDPAAAREAVTRVFSDAFEGAASDQAKTVAIEGGGGLVSVFDELRQGQFARQVAEAKTVIDGVVFVSATDAAVEFHSDLGPDGRSGPYFGDAILSRAGWQVSHASYCQIITYATAHCP